MKLASTSEIAEILGVTPQRADQLTATRGFPKPMDTIAAGRIWKRADIEAWARAKGRL